jgi:phage gpG-like protein
MFTVDVKVEDQEAKSLFRRLKSRMQDMTPVMKTVGEIITSSVIRNFEVGGRPQKWQKLAASTIAQKGHSKPLIGATTNLMSVTYKASSDRVTIGPPPAAKAYMRIHQLGGTIPAHTIVPRRAKALRWTGGDGQVHFARKVNIPEIRIPARPYLLVQDEDWTEIRDAATTHLMRKP